jgi:hypothetical protein
VVGTLALRRACGACSVWDSSPADAFEWGSAKAWGRYHRQVTLY